MRVTHGRKRPRATSPPAPVRPVCVSFRFGLSLSVYSRYCLRICSVMVGAPHRPLLPSLPTPGALALPGAALSLYLSTPPPPCAATRAPACALASLDVRTVSDGPASGENMSHLCKLKILGYFPASWGINSSLFRLERLGAPRVECGCGGRKRGALTRRKETMNNTDIGSLLESPPVLFGG